MSEEKKTWQARGAYVRHWLPVIKPSLFFFLQIIYQEFFLKLYCFRVIPVRGLIFTALFSLPISLLLGLWCAAVKPKTGRRILLAATATGCVWLSAQAVYYRMFETFLSLSSLVRTPMVAGEFGGMAVGNILKSWFPILVLCLPFAGAWVWRDRLLDEQTIRRKDGIHWAALALVVHMAGILLTLQVNSGPVSLYHIYHQSDAAELMVTNFGVLTNTRRELLRLVFGVQAESVLDPESGVLGTLTSESDQGEIERPRPVLDEHDRIMDIDFDALISGEEDRDLQAMHEYFASAEPTERNQWTGYFQGKNLVWIVAEAFSTLALDPELTPNLCRLSQEGFVFQNFYTPLWGLSTSDGEYVTTTGLIPKAGTWSYLQSAENYMPFGFGSQFKARGYRTLAYHNNTYTYYGRDESYPNMGYEYYGVGNGLNVARTSPASDLEMMEKSLPQYLYEDRFMVYYLTFSGHLNYNREQNDMAAKHWDLVEKRPLTEGPKAYLASQVELDRAVGYLLEQLEAAGKLDDTVIVLSGDHYPYGLQDEEISELLGHPVDPDFEKYESTLILWNSEMKQPVQVDKYCSSLDVMPTLANLFDLEYDSRLLAGRDILSDAPGLVIFSNYSFLSERGGYRFLQEQFIPWGEGRPDDEQYVAEILQEVRDRFRFSALILDKDYYRYLFAPETIE